MASFLCFQICQRAIITTSEKKGLLNFRLAVVTITSKVGFRLPFNLKIIPNPCTEITLKKQMHPILSGMCWAEHTKGIIGNIPMPPSKHIPCIEPITDQ
jgi:hypothetical protein